MLPLKMPAHMSRRAFLDAAGAGALGTLACAARAAEPAAGEGELARVNAARPRRGGRIPADLARRLATAHVAGRYHFTSEPFLLEGARRAHELGFGGIKLWFDRLDRSYPFNSDWSIAPHGSFVERARHPYFRAAFALPFTVIALEVPAGPGAARKPRPGHTISPDADFAVDEQQMYELARDLLLTYRERDRTFLLQNWEGDWMLRGGTRAEWTRERHPELEARVAAFRSWFNARQRGVERARAEVPSTRCRVFHAVEVNRVFDARGGIPTITSHVLPQIRPDYVSWSCYDGLRAGRRSGDATAAGICEGLDLIQEHARTTQVDAAGRPAVYIGEVGFPEQTTPPDAAIDMIDGAMGAFFTRGIPYIFHWELFCNERKDGTRPVPPVSEAPADLRGFWLIRPDGSPGYIARYFQSLLVHAGGTLRQD